MRPLLQPNCLSRLIQHFCQVVDPLEYERFPIEEDRFGNVVQSNAACISSKTASTAEYAFFGVTMAISVFTLLVSSYQSYRARNLPSAFNESKYIAFSNLILVEILIIGVPVLFISRDDPATYSLVMNVLVAVMCLAVLLPVFVPKFTNAEDVKNRRFVPTSIASGGSASGDATSSFMSAVNRRVNGSADRKDSGTSSGITSRFTASNGSSHANEGRSEGE